MNRYILPNGIVGKIDKTGTIHDFLVSCGLLETPIVNFDLEVAKNIGFPVVLAKLWSVLGNIDIDAFNGSEGDMEYNMKTKTLRPLNTFSITRLLEAPASTHIVTVTSSMTDPHATKWSVLIGVDKTSKLVAINYIDVPVPDLRYIMTEEIIKTVGLGWGVKSESISHKNVYDKFVTVFIKSYLPFSSTSEIEKVLYTHPVPVIIKNMIGLIYQD